MIFVLLFMVRWSRPTCTYRSKGAPRFKGECRKAKNVFLNAKRQFKLPAMDGNKMQFLDAQRHFCTIKRKAKRSFNCTERVVE